MVNKLKNSVKNTHLGRVLGEKLIGYAIAARGDRKLTHRQYQELQSRFADPAAFNRYCCEKLNCQVAIDPQFVRIAKKLKADFDLKNFVETGTFTGETSILMSTHFDRVLTCDVKDWPRRIEFYTQQNLIFEVSSSPSFLASRMNEIKSKSLFFLDAHWGAYWPLKDELKIIYENCENPVIIIDDFDAGNGLTFESYGDELKLDFDHIDGLIPNHYKFFLNPTSRRNRGMIFIVPPMVDYGCPFGNRSNYDETKHGLW